MKWSRVNYPTSSMIIGAHRLAQFIFYNMKHNRLQYKLTHFFPRSTISAYRLTRVGKRSVTESSMVNPFKNISRIIQVLQWLPTFILLGFFPHYWFIRPPNSTWLNKKQTINQKQPHKIYRIYKYEYGVINAWVT